MNGLFKRSPYIFQNTVSGSFDSIKLKFEINGLALSTLSSACLFTLLSAFTSSPCKRFLFLFFTLWLATSWCRYPLLGTISYMHFENWCNRPFKRKRKQRTAMIYSLWSTFTNNLKILADINLKSDIVEKIQLNIVATPLRYRILKIRCEPSLP